MEGFAEDKCLSIFGHVEATGALLFPTGAHVLEVGCAEADWMTPMLAQRPDLQITGIDWRPCTRPGTVIQGDVLMQDFPPATFDAMVGISSIEHVGLGYYDDDPLDVDGDRHCMERVVRWLKPGGGVYLDVPFSLSGYRVSGQSHRVYDHAALRSRLIVPGLWHPRWWYCHQDDVHTLLDEPAPERDGFAYVGLWAVKA